MSPTILNIAYPLAPVGPAAAGGASATCSRGPLPDGGQRGAADEQEMADAVRAAERLSPEECRDAACRRFSAAVMVERYLAIYHGLARGQRMASVTRRGRSSLAC